MARSPHKTMPLILLRTYRPRSGGRKLSIRLGRFYFYFVVQFNPYWLQYKKGNFTIHPRRTNLGAEISCQIWRLHLLARIIYSPQHKPRPMRKKVSDLDVEQILILAARAFANKQISPKHEWGNLGREEKLAMFWEAVAQRHFNLCRKRE